jgi:hypothetical protein
MDVSKSGIRMHGPKFYWSNIGQEPQNCAECELRCLCLSLFLSLSLSLSLSLFSSQISVKNLRTVPSVRYFVFVCVCAESEFV